MAVAISIGRTQNGKSEEYIKNSCVPEVYLGVDYKKPGWQVGAGMEILSLVPRTQNEVDGKIYKVSERVSSVSGEAHVKYQDANWLVMAKTLLASNLTQTCMLVVTASPLSTHVPANRNIRRILFSTWLNIVYGKKWKPGLFLGYLKNLGANEALVGKTYGVGLDVDQVFTTNLQLSYNLPHWKLGVEYSPSIAWYGNVDLQDGGRIHDTHSITNHRVLGVLIYTF